VARVSGSGEASLSRLLAAENAERHRFTAAVHDDPVQLLTVAFMRLDLLAGELDDERSIAMTDEVRRVVRDALDHTRALCSELDAPVLQREGLVAAIAELGEQLFSDVPTRFTLEADVTDEPPIAAASVLYRASREALSNARRHAEASGVHVVVRGADDVDGIESVVRDNGSGFTPAEDESRDHGGVVVGLAFAVDLVTSVGGRWSIDSEPGRGTTATFWVPTSL